MHFFHGNVAKFPIYENWNLIRSFKLLLLRLHCLSVSLLCQYNEVSLDFDRRSACYCLVWHSKFYTTHRYIHSPHPVKQYARNIGKTAQDFMPSTETSKFCIFQIHRAKLRHRNLWLLLTIRPPCCGYNLAWCVELKSEDLWSCSHKIEPVSLRKCPYDHSLTNKAYLSAIIRQPAFFSEF